MRQEIFFFFCGNLTKRIKVRVRDQYNMWKTKKTMKIKNKKNKKNLFFYYI